MQLTSARRFHSLPGTQLEDFAGWPSADRSPQKLCKSHAGTRERPAAAAVRSRRRPQQQHSAAAPGRTRSSPHGAGTLEQPNTLPPLPVHLSSTPQQQECAYGCTAAAKNANAVQQIGSAVATERGSRGTRKPPQQQRRAGSNRRMP